jgi:hypothetical protein
MRFQDILRVLRFIWESWNSGIMVLYFLGEITMDTLRGHAISINWLGADHTYVTSDSGGVWPCWGRSEGGVEICSGPGERATAQCLSEPWSTSLIIYGVTGVCHQTANRILYPSNATVNLAKWYLASTLLYGTYGTDYIVWAGKKVACGVPLFGGVDGAGGEGQKSNGYEQEIFELYKKKPDSYERLYSDVVPNFIQHETRLAIKHRLGADYSKEKTKHIFDHHHNIHRRKKELDVRYSKGMVAKDFADEANKIVSEELGGIHKKLGAGDFNKLFGSELGERVIIVDHEAMQGKQGS